MKGKLPDVIQYNPGGLAVVWAEENTRDSVFAALRRREAYGTSGPRIVLRFFGGWDVAENACAAERFAEHGYEQGVPMGSLLPTPPNASAGGPSFAVHALQDAGSLDSPGTPLREVQIVKGWVEGDSVRERVYDIARAAGDATVDPGTCVQAGDGAASLCSVWRDPDFDPSEPAFYYARVLENPTCRWSQLVCVDRGVDCSRPEEIEPGLEPCCHESHRTTIQERAWSSPIWFTPPSLARAGLE
jgi:hypothetical protein